MKTIGLPEARGLLARAVLTQGPDFVYNPREIDGSAGKGGCFNIPFGDIPDSLRVARGCLDIPEDSPQRKTGCLIGTAMKLTGDPVIIQAAIDSPAKPVYRFSNWLTKDAERYLSFAQQYQDGGSTWGEAFKKAEETVK
jgi:hypothetical protein